MSNSLYQEQWSIKTRLKAIITYFIIKNNKQTKKHKKHKSQNKAKQKTKQNKINKK